MLRPADKSEGRHGSDQQRRVPLRRTAASHRIHRQALDTRTGHPRQPVYRDRLHAHEDKKIVRRKLKPVAILFSEYYFYLTAFIDDKEVQENFDVLNDAFPTIYRLDRIKKLKLLDEKFHIPYSSRFEEGEFRKRIQFMYGGKLQKVKFEYSGTDVDAVLDRLPTARIIKEEDGKYVIEAEVFGKGIEMWLRSQGENVKLMDMKI